MARSRGAGLLNPLETSQLLEEASPSGAEPFADRYNGILPTLESGHPHQASGIAEEAIGNCLGTVWKASRILRADTPNSLNEELLLACLEGLIPIQKIVDALSCNREFCNSMARFEGYRSIADQVDLLIQSIKFSANKGLEAWDHLRHELSELLDSIRVSRPVASNSEVLRCRHLLLGIDPDYLVG